MVQASETDEATEVAPVRKSKKKLVLIVGALVILLGGGAGAWFFIQGAPASEEAAPPKEPVYLALDTFTVNLQDGEQYLQTDITLQVADPDQVNALKLHMPRIRSRLLSLLSSKHADELATPDDKKKLVKEIILLLNQPLDPRGKPQQIVDVLFTTFVIQ